MSFTNDVFFTGFVKMFRQTPALNPDLWTMADEFTGSIIIFAIGSVYSRLRYRYIILVLAMCFAYYHYQNMSLFIFGVVLGKLRADGIFSVCYRVLPLRILAGLAVLSLPYVNRVFVLPYLKTGIQFPFTCYLIFCLYASKDAVWFFSNKVSCFLGEISFPMYCLTVVTVCTFQSALIVKFSEAGVEVKSLEFATLSAFATVVVTACLACLVRYVETKYLIIVDKIFGLFIRLNSTNILPLSHADPKDFLASPPYHVVPQDEESRFPEIQNPKVDFSDNNHVD
jgi:peptidoglycan/LPS O-acetylase OafA/YrhL